MTASDRTLVSLLIRGEHLEPGEISEILGCEPTRSQRKGQVISSNTSRVAVIGQWQLEAPNSESRNLDIQINEIFNLISVDPITWSMLSSRYTLYLSCGFFVQSWIGGVSISPASMQKLADHHIQLGIDFYGALDDDDTSMT